MRRLPLADRLRVRTPCAVLGDWEVMARREHGRFCASCNHEVHDVSSLTRDEAEALLRGAAKGERLCLHLYRRRSDGAVLLADGHALPGEQLGKRQLAGAIALSAAALAGCAPAPATVANADTSANAGADPNANPNAGAPWWADLPPLPVYSADKDAEDARADAIAAFARVPEPLPPPSVPAVSQPTKKPPQKKESATKPAAAPPPNTKRPRIEMYDQEGGWCLPAHKR